MTINQLSVFLENKQGRLSAALNILAENGIDISALSLAETADYGVLRLIVSDPEKAKQVLNGSGITVRITPMVAVAVNDTPGGAAGAIELLAQNGIAIEYMYACIGLADGKALMVCRVDDNEAAERILEEKGMNAHKLKDIYRI